MYLHSISKGTMKKIKDLKTIDNTTVNPEDFQQPMKLNWLTAPIVNEDKTKLFDTLMSKNTKNAEIFKKRLFSDLKERLAEFLKTSKNIIDDSAFNMDIFSIENIQSLDTETQNELLYYIPYEFARELYNHDAYKKCLQPYIEKELQKIDQKNYDELYNKTYTDYYNRYLSEWDPRAKFHAEKITELCVRSEKNSAKYALKNKYKPLNVKGILTRCYNTIMKQNTEEQKYEENKAEKTLWTVFQN